MRMKKKSLIMLISALTIIFSVAFGTIAYLTDQAGVTNRFTIGNVDIVVDETKVDESGNPIPNPDHDPSDPNDTDAPHLRTEDANEYPLIPGSEYVKDPVMTVKAGSERAYVRMTVTIHNASGIDAIFADLKTQYPEKYPDGFVPGAFVTERDNAVWVSTGTMEKNEKQNTYTLEFRYFEAVEPAAAQDTVLPPLFKTIKLPGELTNAHLSQMAEFAIDIDGYAIQATGFASADEAWAAFDQQAPAGPAQP